MIYRSIFIIKYIDFIQATLRGFSRIVQHHFPIHHIAEQPLWPVPAPTSD